MLVNGEKETLEEEVIICMHRPENIASVMAILCGKEREQEVRI